MRFFKSTLLKNIFFAVVTAIFVDFIAFNKSLSIGVHLVLLIYLVYLIAKNHHRAIMVIIGYGILIPQYPRSILDDVDSLMSGDIQYTTFYSLGVGPLNLYLMLLLLLLIRLTYLNKLYIKLSNNKIIFLFLFFILVLVSFYYNFFTQSQYINLSINYFSTIKFLIYLFIGYLIFSTYQGRINISFFLRLAIILGMRVVLFLIIDF